jgi:Putative prokaryotic signal transducing protein
VHFRRHEHPADDDHRNNEKIVELTTTSSRTATDILVAALESRGIKAVADHGDASGWDPMLSLLQGHRVMVFEGDLEVARQILAEQ